MSKGPEAFRTISEVAGELQLPQHVLRFWETRFSQIRPMKRGGGRRYYRPDDVDLLRGIRHLLYGEGYTIRGVQRILRDQGPRFVSAVGKGEAGPLPGALPDDAEEDHAAPTPDVETNGEGGHAAPPVRVAARSQPLPPRRSSTYHASGEDGAPAAGGALTKDEVRRLQATLFELLECKRLLDQAR